MDHVEKEQALVLAKSVGRLQGLRRKLTRFGQRTIERIHEEIGVQ